MENSNRRQFLKFTGVTIGGLLAAKVLFVPTKSFAQRDKTIPMLDPKDGTAQAIKYVEDYKKVPAAKGNHCANCSFYAKKEMRNGKEAGTCIIFPGKYVYGNGYCNSWAKKA